MKKVYQGSLLLDPYGVMPRMAHPVTSCKRPAPTFHHRRRLNVRGAMAAAGGCAAVRVGLLPLCAE